MTISSVAVAILVLAAAATAAIVIVVLSKGGGDKHCTAHVNHGFYIPPNILPGLPPSALQPIISLGVAPDNPPISTRCCKSLQTALDKALLVVGSCNNLPPTPVIPAEPAACKGQNIEKFKLCISARQADSTSGGCRQPCTITPGITPCDITPECCAAIQKGTDKDFTCASKGWVNRLKAKKPVCAELEGKGALTSASGDALLWRRLGSWGTEGSV